MQVTVTTTEAFIMGYRLIHNDCFVTEKEEYEPGEPVRARFPWIATDTSYEFFIDAANVRQEYVNGEMVFLFIMPGHDVNMSYTSRNTMMRDPRPIHPEALDDGEPLWICETCGTKNKGKFCCECGSARPEPNERSAIDGSAQDRS